MQFSKNTSTRRQAGLLGITIKVTIFLVEQNAKKALELADRAYVLVNGKVTIEGTGQELLKNQDIQAAYLEGGVKN